QAEDGIRDFHVTGVQTCALPIYSMRAYQRPEMPSLQDHLVNKVDTPVSPLEAELEDLRRHLNVAENLACGIEDQLSPVLVQQNRSEERRVGKHRSGGRETAAYQA